jgi:hypothetical protein
MGVPGIPHSKPVQGQDRTPARIREPNVRGKIMKDDRAGIWQGGDMDIIRPSEQGDYVKEIDFISRNLKIPQQRFAQVPHSLRA